MGGNPMAFLFGHGEPFIMAFFLHVRFYYFFVEPGTIFSGREENPMKREDQKTVTPVPWDNMPRQVETSVPHPKSRSSQARVSGTADPTFSSVHAFFPFQATPSQSEEEK